MVHPLISPPPGSTCTPVIALSLVSPSGRLPGPLAGLWLPHKLHPQLLLTYLVFYVHHHCNELAYVSISLSPVGNIPPVFPK